jgi:hypothetical protein
VSLYTVQSSSSKTSLARAGLLPLAGISGVGTMMDASIEEVQVKAKSRNAITGPPGMVQRKPEKEGWADGRFMSAWDCGGLGEGQPGKADSVRHNHEAACIPRAQELLCALTGHHVLGHDRASVSRGGPSAGP